MMSEEEFNKWQQVVENLQEVTVLDLKMETFKIGSAMLSTVNALHDEVVALRKQRDRAIDAMNHTQILWGKDRSKANYANDNKASGNPEFYRGWDASNEMVRAILVEPEMNHVE